MAEDLQLRGKGASNDMCELNPSVLPKEVGKDNENESKLRRASSERRPSFQRSNSQRLHPQSSFNLHHNHSGQRHVTLAGVKEVRIQLTVPQSARRSSRDVTSSEQRQELMARQVSSESSRSVSRSPLPAQNAVPRIGTLAFQQETEGRRIVNYTKYFLIAAFFVFMFGSAITMNELVLFLVKDSDESTIITVVILAVLALISLLGLYGALKEDSCILIVCGSIILILFVLHVIVLFILKNLCTNIKRKCYRNMATPPGLAPILVAISELVIAMCAFFMALVIEAEKGDQKQESGNKSNPRQDCEFMSLNPRHSQVRQSIRQ